MTQNAYKANDVSNLYLKSVKLNILDGDGLDGIVICITDCHAWGYGFDSRKNQTFVYIYMDVGLVVSVSMKEEYLYICSSLE